MSDAELAGDAGGLAVFREGFCEGHAEMVAALPFKCKPRYHYLTDGKSKLGPMDETLIKGFGRRLKEARLRANLTQEQAADRIGLTHSAIGQWERAQQLPDLLNLVVAAETYPASLDWLIWEMGNNIDARVKKLPAILRMPLIERLHREIDDAERLVDRLPKGFGGDPVLDTDEKLKQWSVDEQIRQLRDKNQAADTGPATGKRKRPPETQ